MTHAICKSLVLESARAGKEAVQFRLCMNCNKFLADFYCDTCKLSDTCIACHYGLHIKRSPKDLVELNKHQVTRLPTWQERVPTCCLCHDENESKGKTYSKAVQYPKHLTVCSAIWRTESDPLGCLDCKDYFCLDHFKVVHQRPEAKTHREFHLSIWQAKEMRDAMVRALKGGGDAGGVERKYVICTFEQAESTYGLRCAGDMAPHLRHYKGMVVCEDSSVRVPAEVLKEYSPVDIKDTPRKRYFETSVDPKIDEWLSSNPRYGLKE